jgi:prepilin peptidase CpaA
MTADRLLPVLPLLGLLTWAAVEDCRTRRIRNWLTLSLAVSGLLCSAFSLTPINPWQSILGLLTGFALPFALFVLGAIGAGDVKLLAGIGAWLGPAGILAVFLLEAVIGMVLVVVQATAQGRLRVLARNSAVLLLNIRHVRDVGNAHLSATAEGCRSVDRPLPYALPVLVATILVVTLL